MTTFAGNLNFLCVSSEKLYVIALNGNGHDPLAIDFRPMLREKSLKLEKTLADCCELSPCGNFIVLCVQKEMLLFSTKSTDLLAQTRIEKTASCVRFFNESQRFLVAERSGCVWFYTYSGGNLVKEATHLGHNSVLTDALVSLDDSFIITCDRDEKIRVSHFPNVYNIQSFCLGHEDFVSSLSFLPSDPSVLVSTSGDGTLRLWDYVSGTQLLSYKDEQQPAAPIIKVACCQEGSSCLAIAAKHGAKDLAILSISGSKPEGFRISAKTELLSGNFLDAVITGSHLVVLQSSENDQPRFLICSSKGLVAWKEIENLLPKVELVRKDSINMLFKKRVENVEEYRARKKARLDVKNKI